MTRWEEQSVRCPECAQSVRASLVRVLDLEERPELEAQLLDGALFLLDCPHCGARGEIESPLLLLDAPRALALQLEPEEEPDDETLEATLLEEAPALAARGELLRAVVPSRLALVALLLAKEAGLDERVLRALAADVQLAHPELGAGGVHFAQDAGEELVFVALGEAGAQRLRLPRAIYDELAQDLVRAGALRGDAGWRRVTPESGRALLEALTD